MHLAMWMVVSLTIGGCRNIEPSTEEIPAIPMDEPVLSTQTFQEAAGDIGQMAERAEDQLSALPASPEAPALPAPAEVRRDRITREDDLEVTAEIRMRILEAPNLGTNADNVKILTRDGVVTLRGRVDTLRERERLTEIASGVPGVVRVEDDLDLNLQ